MKTLYLILSILLLCSCTPKNEFTWVYENGYKVKVYDISYEESDSIIKHKFTYENASEYFEIDLHKMTGKYITKGIFSLDSLLTVERINDSSYGGKEVYKLLRGYNDYAYDNEVCFYLERNVGVFKIENINNHLHTRNLVKKE